MSEAQRVTRSSGNVFADLGFPEPEAELAKAKLAQQIARIVADRGWTQTRAAREMRIGQPKVSDLMRGKLGGFSTDRLILLLNRLDQDVTIAVTPRPTTRRRAVVAVYTPDERMAASGASSGDGTGIMG
jgi:predicted XRE-type DNA-binding protein